MAERAAVATRTINGEFISPEAQLSFADASRYSVEITIARAQDVIDTTKSVSVYLEWWDGSAWQCGGGACWQGAAPFTDTKGNTIDHSVFVIRSWTAGPDGSLIDPESSARVRLRVNSPAVLFDGTPAIAGTSGTLRLSGRLLDERAA